MTNILPVAPMLLTQDSNGLKFQEPLEGFALLEGSVIIFVSHKTHTRQMITTRQVMTAAFRNQECADQAQRLLESITPSWKSGNPPR